MHICQKNTVRFSYTFQKRYNPNKQEKPFILSFQILIYDQTSGPINSSTCAFGPRHPGRPTDSQVDFSSKHWHLNRKELHIALGW